MSSNKCNGLVMVSALPGISLILYTHVDGSQCSRPGPPYLTVGALVESEFENSFGICEHSIVAIHELAPEFEPEPVRQLQVTVQNILQTVDRRKAQPKVTTFKDEPASDEIIAKAKIPPKIKVDLSSAPAIAQAAARMPIDRRYEFDLDEDEMREVNSIRGIDEPISDGGQPVNPFDRSFNPERPSAQRKQNVP